jgi:hypothetical protein
MTEIINIQYIFILSSLTTTSTINNTTLSTTSNNTSSNNKNNNNNNLIYNNNNDVLDMKIVRSSSLKGNLSDDYYLSDTLYNINADTDNKIYNNDSSNSSIKATRQFDSVIDELEIDKLYLMEHMMVIYKCIYLFIYILYFM